MALVLVGTLQRRRCHSDRAKGHLIGICDDESVADLVEKLAWRAVGGPTSTSGITEDGITTRRMAQTSLPCLLSTMKIDQK